jgi:class 3 adenylate cyclase
MAIKTENLAIIMTDIVGFTEATVHQSRSDIDVLLDTHNRILLPIVRRYHGRHIKSIGDALLLVYRSPTDAMLCAMAMQDALYEYNRSRAKDKQIRIRVGASLGEVRVTRNDVFGEPVNLTSRIAGVTPPDEIYLSEALYMAMNKAEVPSQEVGWKELKGIGQPVRVYNIPRFAPPRLVPDALTTEDLSDLVYPYGGAHLSEEAEGFSVGTHLKQWRRGASVALKAVVTGVDAAGRRSIKGVGALWANRAVRIGLLIVLALPVVVVGARFAGQQWTQYQTRLASAPPARVVKPAPVAAPETRQPPPLETAEVEVPVRPAPRAEPPAAKAPPVVRAAPPAPTPPGVEPPSVRAQRAVAEPPAREFANRKEVEEAYRNKQIAESEYRRTVKRLEYELERELEHAERAYEAKKMSKDEYKQLVREIKARYDD